MGVSSVPGQCFADGTAAHVGWLHAHAGEWVATATGHMYCWVDGSLGAYGAPWYAFNCITFSPAGAIGWAAGNQIPEVPVPCEMGGGLEQMLAISPEQGIALSLAIAGVWVVAWGLVAIYRAIQVVPSQEVTL